MCARSEYAVDDVSRVTYVDVEDAGSFEAALRGLAPDFVHLHDYADPDVVAIVRRVAPAVLSAHAYPGCAPNTHYFTPGAECDRPHGPGCVANMALRGCPHARDPRPVPRKYRQASRRMAAYARADGVVGHSAAVVRHLTRNGFDAHRVPLFTPMQSLRPQDGADGVDDRHVLFVGRVVPEKGLDVLLRSLGEAQATLTIVGNGFALAPARALAGELAISGRVRFAGWLAGDELTAAYRRSTVVAVPSLWPEPFGLVGLEAMAVARPVVASMTGGIVDWLESGITGLGVAPGDVQQLREALTTVLDDPALARTMGRAGRRSLDARFTARTHVEELEAVYTRAQLRWSAPLRQRVG